jgi:molybdopterin molybdotransferase
MTPADPRMQGFRRHWEVEAVERLLAERAGAPLSPENVPLAESAGRVLSEAVLAPIDLPPFARSAMDGYALCGEETFGASEYSPIRFRLLGASMPGRAFAGRVEPGGAVRIMTGAPIPEGADAVLPAEAARLDGDGVLAIGAVPPGKHVSSPGEDVRAGEVILSAGRRLRPQDVGLLSALGLASVRVVRRPRVAIIVTGSEILSAGSRPEGYRIPDANGPMLAALAVRDGASRPRPTLVPDDPEALRAAICGAAEDVLLCSGGSSVGIEDFVPRIVAEAGELLVHGVAMRPASPTGVGFISGRPVFLLPGNPVSCLCAYDFFAGPTIRALGGLPRRWPYRAVEARLARKIASVAGRVDYARVRLEGEEAVPIAVSGASVLSSAVRADGFVVVPREAEGFEAGAAVTVHLYDAWPWPSSSSG